MSELRKTLEAVVLRSHKMDSFPVKNIGGDFPMLDRFFDFFAAKGIRTVFMSIGNSTTATADLEIAEGLGCPLHAVPLNASEKAQWEEITAILKARKREDTASAFSTGADTKWILPKNIRIQSEIPWWRTGEIDISGEAVKTKPAAELLAAICAPMKIKDAVTRLDILKIDTRAAAPGLEKAILAAMLDAGIRPSLVLVNWSDRPDVVLSATLAAGHLQNSGYRLIGKEGHKFLYYFTDHDMYQLCSWEDMTKHNPLIHEIFTSAKSSQKPEADVSGPISTS
jgi:hypothetical protein